mmetsp:Transcript_51022/g.122095  ORF Transcript_51022/g.122095 Transcript_51022/m.122095 type:complete len:522 (+) Transcript_51022:65-1630(+)
MEGPVELALFEQDKENLQPKRSGRCARVLQEVYSSDSRELTEQRQESQRNFEERLEELDADAREAKVQLWLEYANWAAEWYPTTPSEERSVLERATQSLAAMPDLNNDKGHLQLWLRLAAMEKEPQEIFYYLFTNHIGKQDPALYEEWASVLEKRQEHKKAHDLLFDGMFQCRHDRAAYDRLCSLREALKKRMKDLDIWRSESGPTMLSMQEPARERRPVLNPISREEAAQFQRPLERRPAEQIADAHRALLRVRGEPGFSSVVCEEDPLLPPLESILSGLQPRRTPEIETIREKENKQTYTAVVPRANAAARGRGPRAQPRPTADFPLPVYVDDEFQDPKSQDSSRRPLERAPPSPCRGRTPGVRSASPAMKTPRAPEKESRRKRAADAADEEEIASSSLALSLSQLRLEPPTKRARVCLASAVRAEAPKTPPRRPRSLAPVRSQRSQQSRSWSPPRTSPRNRRGNASSGRSLTDPDSAKCATAQSEIDQEGIAGLQAIQSIFRQGSGYGRSCSRLLVFD